MDEEQLDLVLVLVPAGLLVFGIYHGWLLFTLNRCPQRTVIGLNAESRRQWVLILMADSLKNGVLAVQTIRNNIMASNVQCIRYYTHVSFLGEEGEALKYVALSLNRGSLLWSFGLRAFYLSFPLILWIFGPIPMFVYNNLMCFAIYFLDTTTSFTRCLHCQLFIEHKTVDLEANDLISFSQYDLFHCLMFLCIHKSRVLCTEWWIRASSDEPPYWTT